MYNFQTTGKDKDSAIAGVSDELRRLRAADPAHSADLLIIGTAVHDLVQALPDDPDRDVRVMLTGWAEHDANGLRVVHSQISISRDERPAALPASDPQPDAQRSQLAAAPVSDQQGTVASALEGDER